MPRKHNPIDVEIGAQLRAIRIAAKMTQEALGDAIGLTFQQIQKYERGTNRVSGSRFVELAKILKVPVTVFFGKHFDGSGKASPIIDPRLDSKTRQRLIEALVALDNSRFESILLDLAEQWLKKR